MQAVTEGKVLIVQQQHRLVDMYVRWIEPQASRGTKGSGMAGHRRKRSELPGVTKGYTRDKRVSSTKMKHNGVQDSSQMMPRCWV